MGSHCSFTDTFCLLVCSLSSIETHRHEFSIERICGERAMRTGHSSALPSVFRTGRIGVLKQQSRARTPLSAISWCVIPDLGYLVANNRCVRTSFLVRKPRSGESCSRSWSQTRPNQVAWRSGSSIVITLSFVDTMANSYFWVRWPFLCFARTRPYFCIRE